MADQQTLEDADPYEEIVRLEERIEELAAKVESCRKFILASRIAVAGGGLVLAAILVFFFFFCVLVALGVGGGGSMVLVFIGGHIIGGE